MTPARRDPPAPAAPPASPPASPAATTTSHVPASPGGPGSGTGTQPILYRHPEVTHRSCSRRRHDASAGST